jgi:hypothetical protein
MKSAFFERIYLTHANLKRKVHVVAGTLAAYHYSEAVKATAVHTIAGVFPVVESPEEIDIMLDKLATKETQDVK